VPYKVAELKKENLEALPGRKGWDEANSSSIF